MTTQEKATLVTAIATGVVAFSTLIWSAIQFTWNKKTEASSKQFDIYHRLIRELVEPGEKGVTYLDRQCAIVFELKHFRRFRELSVRILSGLKIAWSADPKFLRLITEIDLTLQYLKTPLTLRVLKHFRLSL